MSLIVFVPIPYVPVLIISLVIGRFDFNLLAFASALGVTLGNHHLFGCQSREEPHQKGNIIRMTPLQLLLARYGSLSTFVVSLIPGLPV